MKSEPEFITEPGLWSIRVEHDHAGLAAGRDRKWSPIDLRKLANALNEAAKKIEAH